jgi:hypothetical protein
MYSLLVYMYNCTSNDGVMQIVFFGILTPCNLYMTTNSTDRAVSVKEGLIRLVSTTPVVPLVSRSNGPTRLTERAIQRIPADEAQEDLSAIKMIGPSTRNRKAVLRRTGPPGTSQPTRSSHNHLAAHPPLNIPQTSIAQVQTAQGTLPTHKVTLLLGIAQRGVHRAEKRICRKAE